MNSDLYAYQKRGFLQEDFKLFHIKDSSLENIDYHYHDFNKIYILLSGNVVYNIEGESYPLAPYDIVLVSKHQLHRPEVDYSTPYERILLYTSLTEASILSQCFQTARERHQPVVRIENLPFTRLFASLKELERTTECTDFAGDLYQTALYHEFLILLNRTIIHRDFESVSAHATDNKVHHILSYINEHLSENLSIDLLSARFYISKYHLMRTFKAQTGYSLHHYIVDKRLLLAKELLANDYPIGEVCYQCGFQDYTTFYRAYKKKYGIMPSRNPLL